MCVYRMSYKNQCLPTWATMSMALTSAHRENQEHCSNGSTSVTSVTSVINCCIVSGASDWQYNFTHALEIEVI